MKQTSYYQWPVYVQFMCRLVPHHRIRKSCSLAITIRKMRLPPRINIIITLLRLNITLSSTYSCTHLVILDGHASTSTSNHPHRHTHRFYELCSAHSIWQEVGPTRTCPSIAAHKTPRVAQGVTNTRQQMSHTKHNYYGLIKCKIKKHVITTLATFDVHYTQNDTHWQHDFNLPFIHLSTSDAVWHWVNHH